MSSSVGDGGEIFMARRQGADADEGLRRRLVVGAANGDEKVEDA